TWRAVADGRTRVVVGARSALFLPFAQLGLIVVDEEHDSSYKQEDGVIYQARDMAVLRASLAQIPIVLVSATPSLETVVNIARGRYQRVSLPRRHAAAVLPAIALVDMRRERIETGRFLSAPLVEALGCTLAAGEPALLFLNRRGDGGAALRHADRDPDRRQGPSLPDAHPGRGGRRRSRPDRRRSARRRAHLPAAASGRRTGRARGPAGPRADADLHAGAAGDAG